MTFDSGRWKSGVSKRRGRRLGFKSASDCCRSLKRPVPIAIGIPIMMHSETPASTPEFNHHNNNREHNRAEWSYRWLRRVVRDKQPRTSGRSFSQTKIVKFTIVISATYALVFKVWTFIFDTYRCQHENTVFQFCQTNTRDSENLSLQIKRIVELIQTHRLRSGRMRSDDWPCRSWGQQAAWCDVYRCSCRDSPSCTQLPWWWSFWTVT